MPKGRLRLKACSCSFRLICGRLRVRGRQLRISSHSFSGRHLRDKRWFVTRLGQAVPGRSQVMASPVQSVYPSCDCLQGRFAGTSPVVFFLSRLNLALEVWTVCPVLFRRLSCVTFPVAHTL